MKTKSIILAVIALILVVFLFAWFIPNMTNKQIWDMTFSFDRAIISLPDGGIVSGEIASWKDFDDGDQIQVKFKDGVTYLTHISNVVMISE